ncbi:hypothetical protein E2P81_ATG02165 [Venturia nashicola]|nr:hypothetical protein E2P81_ATG02165 [Venturia nashicola]
MSNGTPVQPLDPGLAGFRAQKEECVLCNDKVSLREVEALPCGHYVCREGCLPQYFENAMEMQSLYPPKCCYLRIEIADYQHVLKGDLVAQYLEKTHEYQTDPRLRRYCSKDDTFLPPKSYEDHNERQITVARCKTCAQSTCIVCTQLVQPQGTNIPSYAHDCKPKKVETNKEYSKDNRFKGCPFCGRLGILQDACNHITCSCGGEWCFICLEPLDNSHDHNGCEEYGDPEYDGEGYDSRGFHRDTGFDRQGYTRAGYNIRGLNRQGGRMHGFADRVPGPEESEEDRWEREWLEAEQLGQTVFELFVTQAFARFDGQPEDRARFRAWILENDMVLPEDQHLLAGVLAPNQPGALPHQADDSDSDDEESDDETFPPSGPLQVQRSCQHEFAYRPGTIRCAVCTLPTEGVYADCPTCNVRTCLDCSRDFLGNVELNWPVDEGV